MSKIGEDLLAGEPSPDSTVSRPKFEFTVPGATASTFEGAAILEKSLQHLLKSRSRLGGFARSFAALRFAPFIEEEATRRPDVFPMPLPYPEVLLKRGLLAS